MNYWSLYKSALLDAQNSVSDYDIEKITTVLLSAFSERKNIFVMGNGGSASISNHICCDHLKGIRTDSHLFPRVYSLSSNFSLISAVANDIGYEDVFSYQLQSLAECGDLCWLVSSSGNSENIISAANAAKAIGMKIIAFVGFDGGELKDLADFVIHVKSYNYGIVEDVHQQVMHAIAQHIRISNNKKLSVEKI
jgi:D-sedoheptulose 7-phosphate isomerase